MKRAALLLLAGEERSISGSVTQPDDGRGLGKIHAKLRMKVILLDIRKV